MTTSPRKARPTALAVSLIVHPEAKRLLESHCSRASSRGADAYGDGVGRGGVAAEPDLTAVAHELCTLNEAMP